MTLHLIACSATKLARPAPARALYTSDLFRKSVAYVEALGAPWVVLSALHGLVTPETVLTPYDQTLFRMTRQQRAAWGNQVTDELMNHTDRDVVFLAGVDYRKPIMDCARWRSRRYRAVVPMAGLGIGDQKSWLLRETRRLAA